MKLVQMPVDLLHLEEDDLADLGVDGRLLAGYGEYLARAPNADRDLAILATAATGTRELLMVLARRVGVALRDENIRLRDRGGDLRGDRKKLCYLPGRALPEALRLPTARTALEREAACFFQDLEAAWQEPSPGAEPLDPNAFLALLDTRRAGGLPTFVSADPRALPPGLEAQLQARVQVLRA